VNAGRAALARVVVSRFAVGLVARARVVASRFAVGLVARARVLASRFAVGLVARARVVASRLAVVLVARARVVASRFAVVLVARARVPASVIVLAVAAGCGGGEAPPAPHPTTTPGTPAERPEPSDEEQIAALFDERAAALEAGDLRAYVATGGRGIEVRRARRLRLRDVTLEARNIRVSGDRARVRVEGGYAFEGLRGSFETRERARVVRTRDGWRVSRAGGSRGRPPWEVDDFHERRSAHFVVLAPPEVPAGELVRALEDGYATMRELLTSGRLRRRYLVVVAAGPDEARSLTLGIRGLETLAALSDASVIQGGPAQRTTRVLSLRLVVVWPPFSQLDADGRRRVVTHELTHAALTGSTSGRTPAWLTEGVALYVSGDRRPAPPGADLGALSKPGSIAALSGDAQGNAYAVSSAAAFAIADHFGTERLLDLYEAFNDPKLRGPRLVDRALRRELGISLAELEASLS
jgi:hypothetical protein